ncbi:MAG TPA: hypothetical protein VFA74_16435 [Terriglobales bacterium]|nr:hypothetical protein [Terriglobales bacterium]
MSLIQDIPAERLARLLHHYQEALTNQLHETGTGGNEALIPWEQTSEAERKLLIAAAQLSLLELDSTQGSEMRSYYAKPGKASGDVDRRLDPRTAQCC